MTIRTKFLIGSGFAVTLAAVSIPACSSDPARTSILGNSAGGSSSAAGGNAGMTGGKASSGVGGAVNNAMGGKASGVGGAVNNAMGGKASGGTPNNNSGGAVNNSGGAVNNSGGAVNNSGGAVNNSGGSSSGTGGGGNGGPAIGTGMVTCPDPVGMSDCAAFCAAWTGNGCDGEATANINCMTACPQFTMAQFCCRSAAIGDPSPLGDISTDLRGVACEWAGGLGCGQIIPAADGNAAIPAMPAACGPAVAAIANGATSCP